MSGPTSDPTSDPTKPGQTYCHAKPRQEPRPCRGRYGAQTRSAKAATLNSNPPAPGVLSDLGDRGVSNFSRPDFQPPTHRQISFLSRPSTSLAESDEEGSFRWASNRVSASFSSSVVKPWSSNSITRRTNACRSCGFQLGSSWSTSVTLIFLSMSLRDGSYANDMKPFVTRSHPPHLQNAPQAQGSHGSAQSPNPVFLCELPLQACSSTSLI